MVSFFHETNDFNWNITFGLMATNIYIYIYIYIFIFFTLEMTMTVHELHLCLYDPSSTFELSLDA